MKTGVAVSTVAAAATLAGCTGAAALPWAWGLALLLLVGACTREAVQPIGLRSDAAADVDPGTDLGVDVGTDPGVFEAGVDLGVDRPDLGPGEWEPCCVDGVIEVCFCPAGAVCNYGPGLSRCGGDGGAPDGDAGGR